MVRKSPRWELPAFVIVLAAIQAGLFHASLLGGEVLSPADVLLTTRGFWDDPSEEYVPENRLLMDPVLQFQPWVEFNRESLRNGRLPLWNDRAGCGAPHLANGQSAVFDPFQLIAYLSDDVPGSWARMSWARLVFAGTGMFLLVRNWGVGPLGRWFAGLAFPMSGYLTVWLLYPVTNAGVWLPWLLWSTDIGWAPPSTTADAPVSSGRRWARALGGGAHPPCVAGTLLGGHIQTSAHVLLLAGLYVLIRYWADWRGWARWGLGVALGVAIAAVQIVPLGAYLSRSPVWEDREKVKPSPWTLARPRLLESACTALPYLYGSQRRGQPNLARAIGANNINESAGGYAGLATLIWLAPLGWAVGRRRPVVRALGWITLLGALGAFTLPPVDNVLRALPVLSVTDNRRLTFWVAFGLVSLGAFGIDRLAATRRGKAWGRWGLLWTLGALAMLTAAGLVRTLEPRLRDRAVAHYIQAANETPGADTDLYRRRGERQARETVEFVPRYLTISAAHLLALAAGIALIRRRSPPGRGIPCLVVGLTLADLAAFGYGLNPAIDRSLDRPLPPLIARLRERLGRDGRMLALGAEMPPNAAMRYGLADIRNYDSVEMAGSLGWFAPLYPAKGKERTSRREVTWERVVGSLDCLRASGVRAIVSPTAPSPVPPGVEVEPIGRVWVAWIAGDPLVSADTGSTLTVRDVVSTPGDIAIEVENRGGGRLKVLQTYDPGWRAESGGRPLRLEPLDGVFLRVDVPEGVESVRLIYDPTEVRIGGVVSLVALALTLFTLTGFGRFRFTRITGRMLGRTRAVGVES